MHPKRALIVDDSRSARASLKKNLEKCELDVDCVESGEHALEFLSNSSNAAPDIIFMDNMMPGISGLETTKSIREDAKWHHIPIIICTATEGDKGSDEALAVGAESILAKPATVEKINEVLITLREKAETANTEYSAEQPSFGLQAQAPPQASPQNDTLFQSQTNEQLSTLTQTLKSHNDRLKILEAASNESVDAIQIRLDQFENKVDALQKQPDPKNEFKGLWEESAPALQDTITKTLQAELHGTLEQQLQQNQKKLLSELPDMNALKAEIAQASGTFAKEQAAVVSKNIAAKIASETSSEVAKSTAAESVTANIQRIQNQVGQSVSAQIDGAMKKQKMVSFAAIVIAIAALATHFIPM